MLHDLIINDINLIELIPVWISAIADCSIPFILHHLAKKNEELRIREIKEKENSEKLEKTASEKKQNELLSIERCSKLYSAPIAKANSSISLKLYNNFEISKNSSSHLLVSYNPAIKTNENIKALKLSLIFDEKNNIKTTKFIIDYLRIWIIDNSVTKDDIKLEYCLNDDFCKVFSNDDGTVLNIYILFDDNTPISNYFINFTDIRIILKGKVNNPFNIETEAIWNVIASYDSISENQDTFIFKTTNSIFQLLGVNDKNI